MKKLNGLFVVSVIVGSAHAGDFSTINVKQLDAQANLLKNKLGVVVPVFQQIVAKVEARDFEGLRSYLKSNAATLDLNPTIRVVKDNFDALKPYLEKAVNEVSKVAESLPGAPSEVKAAVQMAKSNLGNLDAVKNALGRIDANANLAIAIDKIVDALKAASADTKYMSNLRAIRDNVRDSFDVISRVDFTAIEKAIKPAQKLANGKELNLTELNTIAAGLTQVLQLVSESVYTVQQLALAAIVTNKKVLSANLQMPDQLRTALLVVDKNGTAIYEAIGSVNTKLYEALASAGLVS